MTHAEEIDRGLDEKFDAWLKRYNRKVRACAKVVFEMLRDDIGEIYIGTRSQWNDESPMEECMDIAAAVLDMAAATEVMMNIDGGKYNEQV